MSCVCAQYNPCGCDDTDNSTSTIQQELQDGTANITTVNGTKTVVVNGTLDNGTDTSGAVALFHAGSTAVWPVALMVGAMIWGL